MTTQDPIKCEACDGSGKTNGATCANCNGTGEAPEAARLRETGLFRVDLKTGELTNTSAVDFLEELLGGAPIDWTDNRP